MFQAKTRRSNLNEYYYYEALQALLPDDSEKDKAQFAYVIHPVTEEAKRAILTELGRLMDPETIREAARQVCTRKLRTREAVILIRRLRQTPKPGSIRELSHEINHLIDDYLLRHPDFTLDQVLDALEDTRCMVEDVARDAAR